MTGSSRSAFRFETFFPFLLWIGKVDRSSLQSDFIAGLTNAFIVLPQGVAFAMIAGLPPEYGLYTAIIPPIIAGLFGSSMHLVSGPTTAISIVVFAAVSPLAEPSTPQYISLVLTLTLLAGLIQMGLGIARMGALVNFISHSVVVGFTAGAAIIIATSQIRHVMGVSIPKGDSFIHTWEALIHAAPEANVYALIVAGLTIAVILVVKRISAKAPAMLLGMIAASIMGVAIGAGEHNLALVGALSSSLPPLSMPDFSRPALSALTSSALAISMLGLIEAVSIARSVASKSGQTIDGNQEFIGQGLSNITGSFFSCYASSGSFTRSGVNYSAGAKTPLSAVFAALLLAVIIMLFGGLAAHLPIAAMGGVVLVVAYNLVDFHGIKSIIKASASDTSVMVITFLATLFVELEFAIYVGVMLSLILYLNRTSKPRIVARTPDPNQENRRFVTDPDAFECPQLKIIRIDGSIYFGSVPHVQRAFDWLRSDDPHRKHLLIVCSGINFLDVAGAEALEREAGYYSKMGGGLYMYGAKKPVRELLSKGGYMDSIGAGNMFDSKKGALSAIIERLDHPRCAKCHYRIFLECKSLPAPPQV